MSVIETAIKKPTDAEVSTEVKTHWLNHYDAQLLPQRDEPEWMSHLRKQAWELYMDMPDTTPLQRGLRKPPVLDRESLGVAELVSDVSESLQARVASWGDCSGLYLAQNNSPLSVELQAELSDKGVVLLSLSDALVHYPELVQKHFGKVYPATSSKELALNTAYWNGGYFLYVPANVQVELPICVLQSVAGEHTVGFQRSLVIADRGAQVTLIHDAYSENEQSSLVSDVVELWLNGNAQINAVYMQNWDRQMHALHYAKAHVSRDARYHVLNLGIGAAFHEVHTGADLEEAGASTDIQGLFVGNGQQHFRQQSMQNHNHAHTVSDLMYHTVLKDEAYSFYHGMIYVDPQAQQTVSNQVSKSLLLSDSARSDAIPNLEILADDVQSGHGAAVGSLNPDQMFYLQSRGFDQETAEAMLVEGFMEAVILRFPVEALQAVLRQHLAMRLLVKDGAE